MSKRVLFALWGVLFILCAGMGMIPEPEGLLGNLLTCLAGLFFLPPAVLLYRAKKNGDHHTRRLIASLSALSLGLTLVLLTANFLSAAHSEVLGTGLYYVLVIVSSPMICSGYWVASLFGWACLLTASLQKAK